MPPPRSVEVAVAVVTDGQCVLIARRPPDVPLGGLWEFPGGKLEPGETPETAAVREVQEELGLTVTPVGRLTALLHTYPHAHVRMTPVCCRYESGTPQAIGCTEFRWVPPTDLADYAFPAANGPLLQEVQSLPLRRAMEGDMLATPTPGD